MKEQKLCGIYIIKNTKSNKIYIGQSVDIKTRWKHHIRELNRNRHLNSYLQRAWNSDGEKCFTFDILELCERKQLNEKEKYWIDQYGGYENQNNYNLKECGETPIMSIEVRKRMSESHKGKSTWNKGLKTGPISEETRIKLRLANIGKKGKANSGSFKKGHIPWSKGREVSAETREKLRKANTGRVFSEERNRKIGLAHKGKKLPKEVCEKISKARKGMVFTEEHRRNIGKGHLGKPRYTSWNKGIPWSAEQREKIRLINQRKKEQKLKVVNDTSKVYNNSDLINTR